RPPQNGVCICFFIPQHFLSCSGIPGLALYHEKHRPWDADIFLLLSYRLPPGPVKPGGGRFCAVCPAFWARRFCGRGGARFCKKIINFTPATRWEFVIWARACYNEATAQESPVRKP